MVALRIPGFSHPRSQGEALLRSNRLAEAEAMLVGEAASRRKDPRPCVLAGHLALMRNDLDQAEARLSDAVARDRNCREAHELLAEIDYRRGDFEAAAVHQQAAGNRPAAAKLRYFESREPYSTDGPAETRVPFVVTDPLPIVTARINGAEARFLIDTGGAEPILDASFAAGLGVPLFGGESGFYGGGKTGTFAHGAVDSLALGDMEVGNVPVTVMDLGQIGTALGQPGLAGIVGTCLLFRFLATIDYLGEALVLRRKGAEGPASAGAIAVPFLMADDHFMLAEGALNGCPPALYFVDSGLGGGAFTCPASTLKEAGIVRGRADVYEGRGGGGTMAVWPFDIETVSLGSASRSHLQGIAGAFPPQLEWAYGFRIGGLISHGFLRAYAVTFDFDRMSMCLDPAPV